MKKQYFSDTLQNKNVAYPRRRRSDQRTLKSTSPPFINIKHIVSPKKSPVKSEPIFSHPEKSDIYSHIFAGPVIRVTISKPKSNAVLA